MGTLQFYEHALWYRIGVDESPRWLVSKGREEEAIRILEKVAKINKGPHAQLPQGIHFKEELEKQVHH